MTESSHQSAIVEYCAWKAAEDWRYSLLMHTPNQGKRSARFGAELKRMGMKPGFPDLALLWPRPPYGSCLFLEMKFGRGKTTPAQDEWHRMLRAAGHLVAIPRSSNEGIEIIEGHLHG